MFCPSCGTQNADGSSFCTKCGASIGVIVEKGTVAPSTPPPAVQPPAPRPATFSTSHRATYASSGAPLSWISMIGALAGIGGLFLPMMKMDGSSVFDVLKASFAAEGIGASKWLVLYPVCFVMIALISVLLAMGAASKKGTWLGLVALFTGMVAGFALQQTPGLSAVTDFSALGLGFYLTGGGAMLILLLTLIQLFTDVD